MKVKLTDLTIRSLPIPEKGQADYYDINHPGLCLRVSQGGSKVFTFLNRQHGDRRRVTLGKYPNISLSDARAACRGLAANPAMNTVTFGEAVASYMALATAHMSRSHIYELTRILTKVFQPLHPVPITSITSKHVSDIIDALPANALYTHGRIKTFMRWCRMRALITVNPIEFLPAPSKYVARDRVLSDDEVRRIWAAANQMGPYGAIIQLCLATGQRRAQIAGLQKDWVKDDCIIFPASVMKNGAEHLLPMTTLCAKLISSAHIHTAHSDLLFASGRSTLFSAWSKNAKKIQKLSDTNGWVIHDARRYFRSTLAALGVSAATGERLIGHNVGTEVARIYDRYSYLPEKREAMERYTAHLQRVISQPTS